MSAGADRAVLACGSGVGVSIVESKANWLRLFVAWIADDNVVEGIEE